MSGTDILHGVDQAEEEGKKRKKEVQALKKEAAARERVTKSLEMQVIPVPLSSSFNIQGGSMIFGSVAGESSFPRYFFSPGGGGCCCVGCSVLCGAWVLTPRPVMLLDS